jgi:hypothetical protein
MLNHEKLGLPKYYAVKLPESTQEVRDEFIRAFNSLHETDWRSGGGECYYGYEGNDGKNGTNWFHCVSRFQNNPTVISVDRFFKALSRTTTEAKLYHETLGLPRYYAIEVNGGSAVNAKEAMDEFNKIHGVNWGGDSFLSYGFDESLGANGTSNSTVGFRNPVHILTPTEFLNIINKNTMKHQLERRDALASVTREQLSIINAIAKQKGIGTTKVIDSLLGTGSTLVFSSDSYPDKISISTHWDYNFLPFETFISKMLGTYKSPNIEVVLNDSYKAIVSKDSVKVGCQTFSHEKIKELHEAVQSFK